MLLRLFRALTVSVETESKAVFRDQRKEGIMFVAKSSIDSM